MQPSSSATGGGPPGSNPATLPPPQFFVDHKKGEVNELRQYFSPILISI